MPARLARTLRISRNVFIGGRLLSVDAARTRTLLVGRLHQRGSADFFLLKNPFQLLGDVGLQFADFGQDVGAGAQGRIFVEMPGERNLVAHHAAVAQSVGQRLGRRVEHLLLGGLEHHVKAAHDRERQNEVAAFVPLEAGPQKVGGPSDEARDFGMVRGVVQSVGTQGSSGRCLFLENHLFYREVRPLCWRDGYVLKSVRPRRNKALKVRDNTFFRRNIGFYG